MIVFYITTKNQNNDMESKVVFCRNWELSIIGSVTVETCFMKKKIYN